MVWYWHMWASLIAQMGKNLPAIRRPGFNYWIGKIPGRRNGNPTSVLLPEASHGWRSLAGYGPWGSQKSHTWLSNWHIYKWRRTESPEVIPYIYSQLTFDKGTKKSFFQQVVLGQPDIHMQKKLDSCFVSYIKINSKCVDLTVRARSIKLLGKKA